MFNQPTPRKVLIHTWFGFNRGSSIPWAHAERGKSCFRCRLGFTTTAKWRHQQWRPWFSLDVRDHPSVCSCGLSGVNVTFNGSQSAALANRRRVLKWVPRMQPIFLHYVKQNNWEEIFFILILFYFIWLSLADIDWNACSLSHSWQFSIDFFSCPTCLRVI